jgi:hypothetical protein
MHRIYLLGGTMLFVATSAFAQPVSGHDSTPSTQSHTRHVSRSHGTPLDRGPFTAEANRAYQGGGMMLEGAPGEPAPSLATPH